MNSMRKIIYICAFLTLCLGCASVSMKKTDPAWKTGGPKNEAFDPLSAEDERTGFMERKAQTEHIESASPKVRVTKLDKSFNLKTASKMAILPLRDFTGHPGAPYEKVVLETFTEELRVRYPQVNLMEPQIIQAKIKESGKAKDYDLFITKCITDRNYCIEQNDLLKVFRNSGLNYVANFTIGSLIVPIPGNVTIYYLSLDIYDIDLGGEVVYSALAEGEIYLDNRESAPAYMKDTLRRVTSLFFETDGLK